MAYGDYDGPDKPNKGKEGGACNRSRCQAEPALHWNHGSHSWYCADCARDIGDDPVNRSSWALRHEPRCGHPMFETRQEIDAREAAAAKPEPDPLSFEALFGESIEQALFGRAKPSKPKSASLERMLKQARRR